MTVAELRATELFLDECASLGMDLDEARRYAAARILGNELHAAEPSWSVSFIESVCEKFLAEQREES